MFIQMHACVSYKRLSRLTHSPSALMRWSLAVADQAQWERLEKTSRIVTSSDVHRQYQTAETCHIIPHEFYIMNIPARIMYTSTEILRILMLNAYLSDRRRGNILVIIWAAVSPIAWPDRLGDRKKGRLHLKVSCVTQLMSLSWLSLNFLANHN